ncbi:MAG: hypothetical protein IJ743_00455 [Bacilli bacterium]|nr:hypothetical protein [Bacilli bacterium]
MKYKVYDALRQVSETAEKDRHAAKERGDMNSAVYFQGKIVACNELKEILRI